MEFGGLGGDGSLATLPTRPMRVKVLYTFDAEHKTSCLARFPDILDIPVVAIDEQSQVGVIEMQQCIQAMLLASPEIQAKLETGDFTVYSFDYTEHETPIVGQGRLSSLLSGSAQGKTMIIGRVCKNIQALFSGGVKEILEVKFRLTPLSRPSESEMARQAEGFRSLSPATSSGFDPNAWNASHNCKPLQQPSEYFGFDSLNSGGDNDMSSIEDMFGLGPVSRGEAGEFQQAGNVGVTQTPTDSAYAFNPAFTAQNHSAPGSRVGSPVMHSGSSTHNERLRHQSISRHGVSSAEQARPDSRASVRSETSPYQHQRQASLQSQQHIDGEQQSQVFYNEDSQPRKRAKVTQTDWRGKSSFGSKTKDLRVAAATATSMHMHRPIAKRPSAPGSDLEPPPRVPTPVPHRKILPRPSMQHPVAPRSMLRQASTVDSDFMSDADPMSDAISSPEGSSPSNSLAADATPMDIPSSPPLMHAYNLPVPSSPGLPTLQPQVADSGYMSGNILESLEDDENRSPDAEDLEMAARYRARDRRQGPFVKVEGSAASDLPLYSMDAVPESDLISESGESRDMLQGRGRRTQLNKARPAPPKRHTIANVSSAGPPGEDQAPQLKAADSRRGSLALPSKVMARAESQIPAKQKSESLQRSRTISNDSEAGSPAPSDIEGRPRGNARSGSAVPRRKIIQERLNEKIRRGEVPIYCEHCGAIETPTWRKLYSKEVDGKPCRLDEVEGEGETIGIEIITTDSASGETTKFRIRKSMKSTKESQPGPGFAGMNVCNPCGLWFKKFKSMRPESRWHRKAVSRKNKKSNNDETATDGMDAPSEAFFTDQVVPEDAVDEGSLVDAKVVSGEEAESQHAEVRKHKANSEEPQPVRRANHEAARQGMASRREIQSSPVRFGSQHSPIELDETPAKPTRRLLFPSPRRNGEVKNLDDCPDSRPGSRSGNKKLLEKPSVQIFAQEHSVNIYEAFTNDKENRAPPLNVNEDLSHLFDGSPSAIFKTPLPKTPSKTPRTQTAKNDLLKTPTMSSRKRKVLTPNQNAANVGNITANDFMTSPSSNRYFLRSTPSRLERTPGGRSVSGGSQASVTEPSPFSRHLAAMLNDVNGIDGAPFTSPSRQYDFSDLPNFTPGHDGQWKGLDEILSSEFANYDEHAEKTFDSESLAGEQA